MKKIDGEFIQQVKTVEVGAKYVAEDGKTFSTKSQCKQYEDRLAKKKLQERLKVAYQRITGNRIEVDTHVHTYVCTFDTKEEFINICKTLHRVDHDYSIVCIHLNGNDIETTREEDLPAFPAKFVVLRTGDHDDDYYWDIFDFIPADDYIKELEKKIEVVKNAKGY